MKLEVGVIRIGVHNLVHLVHQPLITQGREHLGNLSAVDGFHDPLLEINGKALIQPKVIPGGVGY